MSVDTKYGEAIFKQTQEVAEMFKAAMPKITTNKKLQLYALNDKKNDLNVISHSFKGEGQFLRIKLNSSIQDLNLNLIGKIQLNNVFMAIIAAKKSGISLNQILNTLSKVKLTQGQW